jgi:hypothetical protein
MNPALVRKFPATCAICRDVAAIEDVNARCVDEYGERRRGFYKAVQEYLKGVGSEGYGRSVVTKHADHVSRDMKHPPAEMHPAKAVGVTPAGVPATWFDLQEQGMEVGMDALREAEGRIAMMEDKDLIALAKLGITAASKRADIESRGRQTGQVLEAVMLISSGMAQRVSARVGPMKVVAELGAGAAGVTVDGEG